jgi:hypothetical protein
MARRIFRIVMAVAIAIAIYLYLSREAHTAVFSIVASSLAFLLFSFGVHGLIAHSLHPKFKGNIIVYPIWMWALWAILFLLFVFLLIPQFCPGFAVIP